MRGRALKTREMLLSQAISALLGQLQAGAMQDRCYAAHTLASLLEAEEAKYRALVGDPHSSPSLRNHYTIGKLLSAIKVRQQLSCKPIWDLQQAGWKRTLVNTLTWHHCSSNLEHIPN
jgi:hypothetical protein